MTVENAVFAETKTRCIHFSFGVSGSLESKISSSVENMTCMATVAIWLLLHLPAVAVRCGCPLSCAFEHLSHGCQGKGLGHPRYRMHVWLQCTVGPAQTMAVSSTFTVMIAGCSLWGWPCVRSPCFLSSAQWWQDGCHPPAQGVLLLAGSPPTQPPCLYLTPKLQDAQGNMVSPRPPLSPVGTSNPTQQL